MSESNGDSDILKRKLVGQFIQNFDALRATVNGLVAGNAAALAEIRQSLADNCRRLEALEEEQRDRDRDTLERAEAALAGSQHTRAPLDPVAVVKWLLLVVAALAVLALAVAVCLHPELIPVVLRLGGK